MNRILAPEIKPVTGLETRFPESTTNVFRIDSGDGVFKLDIVFPEAGQVKESNKFAAGMAINLLMSGNAEKSAAQIADEIDQLGGFVFKSSDYYSGGISIYGLNEYIEKTISLTKKAIDSVSYLEDETSVYKRNRVSELNINLQKTSYLASKGINKLLCGENHDLSFQLTEAIIQGTSREELVSFKDTHLRDPYFIFTGSASIDIEKILLSNSFEIKAYTAQRIKDKPLLPGGEKQLFIAKEGSTQNSIRFGAVWPERGHPDFFKLSLLNLVLGGYFGSRLMKNIREDKGLTYGIHSSVSPYNDFSLFKISCEFNSNFTEKLINEIYKEIEQLKTTVIGEEELTVAKNYLLGVMLRSFDGAFPISDKFKQFMDARLDKNYYKAYFSAINSITAQELKEVANNYFRENTLTYCLSGV